LTTALAVLASLAVAAGPRDGVPALVRRCVEAYGGKLAITTSVRSLQEGTVTSILHAGERGRIVRAYGRPGRLRVEISWPGGDAEVRVLDGGRGWRNGEEVSGPRLAAMILQAMRLDLPALLASWQEKLVDAGTLDLGGKALRVVSLEPAPGLVLEAAIDPASGRILRSRAASRDPGMPLEFVTTYSEFREIDGVLLATREENWANGKTTGETVLGKIEFPAVLPERTFRP